MAVRKDLKGKVFGKLFVLDFEGIRNKKTMWLCECECGMRTVVWSADLRNGNTKSCGCLRKENSFGRRPEPTWI